MFSRSRLKWRDTRRKESELVIYMVNNPVGDFVTRIKNAAAANRVEVFVPYSKTKEQVAKVLVAEGYLSDVRHDVRARLLKVKLTYKRKSAAGKIPAITGAKNISKPGVRIYAGAKAIPLVPGGIGITIISTSSGIMSNRVAKKKGLGGEILAKVW